MGCQIRWRSKMGRFLCKVNRYVKKIRLPPTEAKNWVRLKNTEWKHSILFSKRTEISMQAKINGIGFVHCLLVSSSFCPIELLIQFFLSFWLILFAFFFMFWLFKPIGLPCAILTFSKAPAGIAKNRYGQFLCFCKRNLSAVSMTLESSILCRD